MGTTPADETRHAILRARDPRYDGVFFVAVKTTGIYCRPICPARTPLPGHCRFFDHAPQAEAAGYRPCLRCRPELAPGLAPTEAVATLAESAAARLTESADLESIAAEFGVSSRHLRRAVRQVFGVSPRRIRLTRRLLLAKQLLTDTRVSIERIALAAGFGGARRFHAAFQRAYGLAPSRWRTARPKAEADAGIRLRLAARPPFDMGRLLEFLHRRAITGVEEIRDGRLRRTLEIDGRAGWIEVTASADRVGVDIMVSPTLLDRIATVIRLVRRVFDLDARPDLVAARLRPLPPFDRVFDAAPGLRIPGSFSGFEVLWRAILGQQVSVSAATTLAGRFAGAFGMPLDTPHAALTRASPTPQRVARADPDELGRLGIIRARAHAIQSAARAIAEGRLRLDGGALSDGTVDRLKELPGVGDWTARYVAMRLGDPDSFPAGDLVLRRSAGIDRERDLARHAEAWRPWRSYAALHLGNAATVLSEPGSPPTSPESTRDRPIASASSPADSESTRSRRRKPARRPSRGKERS